MKLFNILVISILLFFIGCTAWPILNPGPSAKKKTTIYPIPLPSTTTSSVAEVRISQTPPGALATTPIKHSATLQLKIIDKAGAEITTGTNAWTSSQPSIATVSASGGLVTATTTSGTTTISVVNSGFPSVTATVDIVVSATGASVLAFDGKNFLEISPESSQILNEEK